MIEVYDLETLAECFTYTGKDIDTGKVSQFVISKWRDDSQTLLEHLKKLKGQIGYNNLAFDYPILHYFMTNFGSLSQLPDLCRDLYDRSQLVINVPDTDRFKYQIPEWVMLIPQLDLFKVWHYDNKNKSCSLKKLQVSMNYPNVLDMPIRHNAKLEESDINRILEYNLNDVESTYQFYLKTVTLGKCALRNSIRDKYGLQCRNWNNGKIGEQLILKLYCDKTGQDRQDVKQMRTKRSFIELKDCIPNGINFKTKEFTNLLSKFANKVINVESIKSDKQDNKVARVLFNNCLIDYALGGVHGVTKSGVYVSDDSYIIESLDVSSLYPNLPIVYNFYPEHLGVEFLNVYRDGIVNVRLAEKAKPKHLQDKAIIDGLKESANIPYGKSNEANSFLYDPLFTMKTTVAGQLVITMLAERLSEIPDSTLLMMNTDGLEIMIPKQYHQTYLDICKQWENEIKLTLEFNQYQKICIRDINNYTCIDINGKIKNKGAFEVDKVVGSEPAYHKDNSFRIVPLAVQEYFLKSIPIEKTIRQHSNIYDFCGCQRFKSDSYGEIRYAIKGSDGNYYGRREEQQKTVRYYISNKGSSFHKVYPEKDKESQIHVGYQVTIFNKFIEKPFETYDINYKFYENECRKIIEQVEDKQMSLFE